MYTRRYGGARTTPVGMGGYLAIYTRGYGRCTWLYTPWGMVGGVHHPGIYHTYTPWVHPTMLHPDLTVLVNGAAVRVVVRRVPGLWSEINNEKEASARLKVSLPVNVGRRLCAELLRSPVC